MNTPVFLRGKLVTDTEIIDDGAVVFDEKSRNLVAHLRS